MRISEELENSTPDVEDLSAERRDQTVLNLPIFLVLNAILALKVKRGNNKNLKTFLLDLLILACYRNRTFFVTKRYNYLQQFTLG